MASRGGTIAMVHGKHAAALLLLLASAGCRMCCSTSDYAPPVINGPYSHLSGRAGSILSGEYTPTVYATPNELPQVEKLLAALQ